VCAVVGLPSSSWVHVFQHVGVGLPAPCLSTCWRWAPCAFESFDTSALGSLHLQVFDVSVFGFVCLCLLHVGVGCVRGGWASLVVMGHWLAIVSIGSPSCRLARRRVMSIGWPSHRVDWLAVSSCRWAPSRRAVLGPFAAIWVTVGVRQGGQRQLGRIEGREQAPTKSRGSFSWRTAWASHFMGPPFSSSLPLRVPSIEHVGEGPHPSGEGRGAR